MTRIDVDGEEGDAASGVTALVVTVVELLVEALEREALRRMERGDLTDEEVERVGAQLAAIEDELAAMKETQGIEEEVDDLRGDLDSLVSDAVRTLEPEVAEAREARDGGGDRRTTDEGDGRSTEEGRRRTEEGPEAPSDD